MARQRGRDIHHLIWKRTAWRGRHTKALREFPYCKVRIPREGMHEQIHTRMENGIPPISEREAERILAELKILYAFGAIGRKDSIERRLQVLVNLFAGVGGDAYCAMRAQQAIVRQL